MRNYIMSKIEEFELKYNLDYSLSAWASVNPDLRRSWKNECAQKDAKWRKINTNDDVIRLINNFDNTVCFVEENVPFGSGHIEDGYNMALAAYNAIQGLRKLAQNIDPKPWNHSEFTELSEAEVDGLFERMNQIAKRMDKQNMRRAMQD